MNSCCWILFAMTLQILAGVTFDPPLLSDMISEGGGGVGQSV